MKSQRKSDKKVETVAGNQRSSSRMSVMERSSHSRRASSATMHGMGQNLAWRSDGKGGFKMPKYQNTYRLEPYLPFKFQVSDRILVQVMRDNLEDLQYDPNTCMELCRNMAAEIRDKLYRTNFDRVKYVISMTVIENAGQSFDTKNGRLFDSERDSYSLYVYESTALFAIGMIVALYYE